MTHLHRPHGTLTGPDGPVALAPEELGWSRAGLRVVELAPGQPLSFHTGRDEVVLLPLTATRVEVDAGGRRLTLDGRTSVFDRVSDFAYVGRDTAVTVSSEDGGQVAVPSARCDRPLPPAYGPADAVPVEVRGGGQATRQVTNLCSPEHWEHADALMCVEVLTPDGNWSSYPPHKHDDSPECPVANEEIYYFRVADAGTIHPSARGFALHRTYTTDGRLDENAAVRDGDVFCVPRGYHGPCVAAPGYDLYYLNVLAGPSGERSMAFCDDPEHHWVRDTWAGAPPDTRCPMTGAGGRS